MIHNTCFVVPYLLFILNVHILPMENHCILLHTVSTLEYNLHVQVRSVNIYISLVICNDKQFVTFLGEGVKIFLSYSNSFVDISFDTFMPIFKFLAPANSSINSDKKVLIYKMYWMLPGKVNPFFSSHAAGYICPLQKEVY